MVKCTHCALEFSRKDNLDRHIKTYHAIDPLLPTPNYNRVEMEEKQHQKPQQKKRLAARKKVEEQPIEDNSVEKSAFNKRLVQKKWFIRGEKDLLQVFKKYRGGVFHAVNLALRKHQVKIDIVAKVRMFRQDKEGEKEEVSQAFYGGPRLILRDVDFDKAYDESVRKIWIDFYTWLSNGSGWILERVENLYLNTAAYDPIWVNMPRTGFCCSGWHIFVYVFGVPTFCQFIQLT